MNQITQMSAIETVEVVCKLLREGTSANQVRKMFSIAMSGDMTPADYVKAIEEVESYILRYQDMGEDWLNGVRAHAKAGTGGWA